MSAATGSIQSFLAMGGYGAYVWGSFGFAAVTIAFELVGLRTRRQALRRQVQSEPADWADLSASVREGSA